MKSQITMRKLRSIELYCCIAVISVAHSAPAQDSGAAEVPKSKFLVARELGREQSNYLHSSGARDIGNPEINHQEFTDEIQPILTKSCVSCHGPGNDEGNLRIDQLGSDLLKGDAIDWWLEVQSVLTNGEMPPPDEGELSEADRTKVIDWLADSIRTASLLKRGTAESTSFRRMTRYEFNYALQDLLGLPYDFANDLPPEAHSEDGFQNSSDMLHMSVSQLETYRKLALRALRRATVRGERPAVIRWGVDMNLAGKVDWKKHSQQMADAIGKIPKEDPEEEKKLAEIESRFSKTHSVPFFRNLLTGHTVPASWAYHRATYAIEPSGRSGEVPEEIQGVAILPRSGNQRFTIELGNQLPDEGTMRVRVRAAKVDPESTSDPTLQLLFGWQASNEGRALLPVPDGERRIKATKNQSQWYVWDVPLGEIYPRNSVRRTGKMGTTPSPSEYIRLVNSSVSQGAIQIEFVEVMTPHYESWPPASHRAVFHPRKSGDNDESYAREVIDRFMQRALGSPVPNAAVDQKMGLFRAMLPECNDAQEAIIHVLSTVLASPQFLYLSREDATDDVLTSQELALRLSTFLWCSLPDQELRGLADDGQLQTPEVLSQQVERMLNDARGRRLSKHFMHQWLDLQLLDYRNVPRGLATLKAAMQQEPKLTFDEMVGSNASLLDFLHADYAIVNERLAQHYGIANVKGNHFRRVQLQPQNRRGGLLTQAGLLAMNSAGEDSHPLKRGVWLLECLLNDPPPPPPPAVPEIDLADPEIAKMTLKEQIEDHRNHAACRSCHSKIDPWGIAFENYDALGRWRNQIKGKPVDASSELFNHETLDGMDGLKQFLLRNRQDQFVRAFVYKLATFALGRPLGFADHSEIDRITAEVRKNGDGIRTTIKLIVASKLFQSR